jgi:hypothetical protein
MMLLLHGIWEIAWSTIARGIKIQALDRVGKVDAARRAKQAPSGCLNFGIHSGSRWTPGQIIISTVEQGEIKLSNPQYSTTKSKSERGKQQNSSLRYQREAKEHKMRM